MRFSDVEITSREKRYRRRIVDAEYYADDAASSSEKEMPPWINALHIPVQLLTSRRPNQII
jgi:hypothetical protein